MSTCVENETNLQSWSQKMQAIVDGNVPDDDAQRWIAQCPRLADTAVIMANDLLAVRCEHRANGMIPFWSEVLPAVFRVLLESRRAGRRLAAFPGQDQSAATLIIRCGWTADYVARQIRSEMVETAT